MHNYIPNRKATVDKVVKNDSTIELRYQVLDFIQQNSFMTGGSSLLVSGKPGTGKTFLVDALLNEASVKAKELGKKLNIVNAELFKSSAEEPIREFYEYIKSIKNDPSQRSIAVLHDAEFLFQDNQRRNLNELICAIDAQPDNSLFLMTATCEKVNSKLLLRTADAIYLNE